MADITQLEYERSKLDPNGPEKDEYDRLGREIDDFHKKINEESNGK